MLVSCSLKVLQHQSVTGVGWQRCGGVILQLQGHRFEPCSGQLLLAVKGHWFIADRHDAAHILPSCAAFTMPA